MQQMRTELSEMQALLHVTKFGRRPVKGDVIQDMKSGRFHVIKFLAH